MLKEEHDEIILQAKMPFLSPTAELFQSMKSKSITTLLKYNSVVSHIGSI